MHEALSVPIVAVDVLTEYIVVRLMGGVASSRAKNGNVHDVCVERHANIDEN